MGGKIQVICVIYEQSNISPSIRVEKKKITLIVSRYRHVPGHLHQERLLGSRFSSPPKEGPLPFKRPPFSRASPVSLSRGEGLFLDARWALVPLSCQELGSGWSHIANPGIVRISRDEPEEIWVLPRLVHEIWRLGPILHRWGHVPSPPRCRGLANLSKQGEVI
jgi:hypothetical protein